jgi:hypothetical protein
MSGKSMKSWPRRRRIAREEQDSGKRERLALGRQQRKVTLLQQIRAGTASGYGVIALLGTAKITGRDLIGA